MSEEPQSTDSMVAALLREREGYVRLGKTDRVEQVDEQLRLRGHKPQRGGRPPKAAAADVKKPEADQGTQAPQGRTQRAPEQT